MWEYEINKMEEFLEAFNVRWDTIKEPEELLNKFIYISEQWIVGLIQYWDMCIMLWSIDVDTDFKSQVEQVKVLVRNMLKHEREKREV